MFCKSISIFKQLNNLRMKSFPINQSLFTKSVAIVFIAAAAVSGCQKNPNGLTKDGLSADAASLKHVKSKKNFTQVNLVASSAQYTPGRIDPLLLNAWGLSWSTTGVAWVAAQAGHVSTVYSSEGLQVRPAVNIPSPGGPTGGNPTGTVFNGGTGFVLPAPNNQPARFLFVGVDGVLSGWNGAAANNAVLIKNNVATSAYTGLAIAASNGATYLYAADFRAGKIAVFDNAFNTVAMSFTDPNLPAGYSPFNVQNVGDKLYVMFAKVGPDGRDEAGMGNGYVSIFNTDGSFVKRFVSGGQLNAPWGIAQAPAGFFEDDGDELETSEHTVLLVGNFGNGHINAYRNDSKFIGELALHKAPLVIDGLWALSFPPLTATTIDPNRLYFTAGPDEESHGIFGYIQKKQDD
jgi:uncharacterized protein (TIGR03118 family)